MKNCMKQGNSIMLWAPILAAIQAAPNVDTRFPYTGPDIPIGDWVDQTVNGNGKGYPRIVEPPAVQPGYENPTNNVNVIALSYVPNGMNIHYQTAFGLGTEPVVAWGTDKNNLEHTTSGQSHTYDRTPPCSLVSVTMCNQFFHEVQLKNLEPEKTYYYKIKAANGTTESDVLSFKTAREAGAGGKFTVAVLNDMGYTNAEGTYKHLVDAATGTDPVAFAWHGGDLSYADDWAEGFMPCEDSWPVCYNGSSTRLPGPAPVPDSYKVPLPSGEVPIQGGPQGGDMSVIYETNWDLWQQWLNNITMNIPYMVMPGNHEASCAEFDGPNHDLSAYLVNNRTNSTSSKDELNYYSCPPSQRNFTAYQNRFRMPGEETNGVSNFWYSFDYGLAHFVTLDGETDFPYSPEWPFVRDDPSGLPDESKTFVTDSGPFGAIDGSWKDNKAYQQWNWLKNDLASVNRTKTPWVFAMSHRPMYSSQTAKYQDNVKDAFEPLMLKYGVDAYLSGHIHWYERLFPIGADGKIDMDSVKNNNTYYTNEGNSITHIINGMAGNIESHSTLSDDEKPLNITNVLDYEHFGFSKLTVHNESAAYWEFIKGEDGSLGDYLWLLKPSNTSSNPTSSGAKHSSSTPVPSKAPHSTAFNSTEASKNPGFSTVGPASASTPISRLSNSTGVSKGPGISTAVASASAAQLTSSSKLIGKYNSSSIGSTGAAPIESAKSSSVSPASISSISGSVAVASSGTTHSYSLLSILAAAVMVSFIIV